MILRVRPGTSDEAKQAVLAQWYRDQVRAAGLVLIAKWGPIMGVEVERVFVQKMKTRWGKLQSYLEKHPAQYGLGKEAVGLPRIYRCA